MIPYFLFHHWNSGKDQCLVKKTVTVACPTLVNTTQTRIPSIRDALSVTPTLRHFVPLTHASHSKLLTLLIPSSALQFEINRLCSIECSIYSMSMPHPISNPNWTPVIAVQYNLISSVCNKLMHSPQLFYLLTTFTSIVLFSLPSQIVHNNGQD